LIGTRGSSPSAATTIIGYTAPQDDTAETNVGCVYVLTASAATSTGANGATTNRFGGDIHGNPPMRLTASNTQGGGGAARYIGYAGSTWSSSGDTPLRNHGLSICPNLYNAVTGAYMHRVLCGDDNYYDGSDYCGGLHIWDIPLGANSSNTKGVITTFIKPKGAWAGESQKGYGAEVASVSNTFGDFHFVGAPKWDGVSNGIGMVFLYSFNKTTGQTDSHGTHLVSSVSGTGAHFGTAIAASGNILAIGAPGKHSVAIYEQTAGNTWVHSQTIVHPSGASGAGTQFGGSLALAGNYLAIGSPHEDKPATQAGAVFVYTSGSSGYSKTTDLYHTGSAGSDYSQLGIDVDMDVYKGTTYIIAGSDKFDHLDNQSGRCYIWENSGGGWSQKTMLHAHNEYSTFGCNVGIDNGVAIAGAYNDHITEENDSGTATGVINIYDATELGLIDNSGHPFRFGAKTVANIRGNKAGTDTKTTSE